MSDRIQEIAERANVPESFVRQLVAAGAVYADSLRRIAKAEADHYEANIERRLRAEGLDERQLIELGTQLGDRVIGLLERVILMVHRRRREHVWTEHAINHVEQALESSGLQQRVPRHQRSASST